MKSHPFQGQCCAVCGQRDARVLVTTRLGDASETVLCGTHELLHRRMGGDARNTSELVERLRERRFGAPRRLPGDDELATSLSAAFSGDRREKTERRAS